MFKKVPKILSLLTKTKLNIDKHPVISDLKTTGEYCQQRINHGAKINVQLSDECTNHVAITQTLEDVFKLRTFRSEQLRTITAVMSKKDVLMIAPSGKNMQRRIEFKSRYFNSMVKMKFHTNSGKKHKLLQEVEKVYAFNCRQLSIMVLHL